MKRICISIALLLVIIISARCQIIWVTNTDNGGDGSLREAIYEANFLGGPDTINFNIPGAGPHIINLSNDLPALDEQVFIDGFSQPGAKPNTNSKKEGSNAEMKIVLNGLSPNINYTGLVVYGSGSKIQGLVINNFSHAEITVYNNNHIIQGNYIGVDADGQTAENLSNNGIRLHEAFNCLIGGTTPETRNIISGNKKNLLLNDCENITINGNYIGATSSGEQFVEPRADIGIWLDGCTNVTIGGEPGNLISGNNTGINIQEVTQNVTVVGNYIGTNAGGTSSLYNERGIHLWETYNVTVGGPDNIDRNIISGNTVGIKTHGIYYSYGFHVIGNYIGFASDGVTPLGNNTGIELSLDNKTVGSPEAPNKIGYNSIAGIAILSGIDNTVNYNMFEGNAIGIDLGGEGLSPNDPDDIDEGPNRQMNFPVFLADSINDNGELIIEYWIDCINSAGTYPLTVTFYESEKEGSPQGNVILGTDLFYWTYYSLGSKTVNLGDTAALGINSQDRIVATTTDVAGNTSEFSEGSYVNAIDEWKSKITYATLSQNSPNPATERTCILYTLSETSNVNLSVYNVHGQHITTLVNQYQKPNDYCIDFITSDIESGIYYYVLSDRDLTLSRKMVVW